MTEVIPNFSPEQLTHVNFCEQEQSHLPLEVEKRTFFYVTDELFESIIRTKYKEKSAVRCSEKEVEEIKRILGPESMDCTTESFFFEKHINCTGCNRTINFYDIFLGAIKHHGVGFLKWAMLGRKKVQMFPKETKQTFVCSDCGEAMVFSGQYGHYSGKGYACT